MNDSREWPSICFYLPEADCPREPLSSLIALDKRVFSRGIYAWTLQTYLHLKASGFPCTLGRDLPSEGIVLAHRDTLPEPLPEEYRNLFIICLKAERDPHPGAQIQVVQNPRESAVLGRFWNPYFIRHWPQPGLMSRDPTRGERFETIAYFGHIRNLAEEFQQESWQRELHQLGLRWLIVPPESWHDYRQVDATLAVRALSDRNSFSKPATKLYNSWHAGVPALLGPESAFQAEGQSELDYLEVASPLEAITALKRLCDNPALRQQIVERGKIRARETRPEELARSWQTFLLETALPVYQNWRRLGTLGREQLRLKRCLALKALRLKQRWVSNLKSGYTNLR